MATGTTERAYRVDRGSLRPPNRRDDGSVRYDGAFTRSGVFTYRKPDGSLWREYRSAKEVGRADSLATLELVPVTDDHPAKRGEAIKRSVGTATATHFDGKVITGAIVVTDEKTIAKIAAGKQEISCGYDCDLIIGAGVSPEGERYDAEQTNIVYEHVAIVGRGRAGHEVRLRMDAAEMINPESDAEELTMDELRKELIAALREAAQEKARADAATTDATAQKTRADAAIVERDAQRARADAATTDATAQKTRADSAGDVMGEAVKSRVALLSTAAGVLGADKDGARFKLDDKTIKLAVVKRIDGDDVPATESDAYINGRYEGAIKRAQRSDSAFAELRIAVDASKRADTTEGDAETQASIKMRNDRDNAWRGPAKDGK